MRTVLIAYASDADAKLISALKDHFKGEGHDVLTTEGLQVDRPFDRQLLQMFGASGAAIVVWTPRALESLWLEEGADVAKLRGNLCQIVFGLEGCPPAFANFAAHDLSEWNGNRSDPKLGEFFHSVDRLLTQGVDVDDSTSMAGPSRSDEENPASTPHYVDSVRGASRLSRSSSAGTGIAYSLNESNDNRRTLRAEASRTRTARLFDLAVPADASAFAPRKLQRGSPELVRVFVHPPEQRKAVERAARALDAKAAAAGPASPIGYVQTGAMVGVLLDVKGGEVTSLSTERPWNGDALDFVFSVEASESQRVTQAVITARIMVDGAQVGLIAFVRPLSKPKADSSPQRAHPVRERFQKAKRVFLSYSSEDRETVSIVAGAYQRAGISCFFDRVSLTGGEEWSPRLLKEIRKADLFHLFWSRNASASEWVVKETEHALDRRGASWTKRPNITVQMLDGPPWAPHPPHLDAINFDDFVRAAVVGYARGEG